MTPDLFGRPGSYPPVCQSPGTCNQGRNCTCGPQRVDNESEWRACDAFCAVALVALIAFVVILGG